MYPHLEIKASPFMAQANAKIDLPAVHELVSQHVVGLLQKSDLRRLSPSMSSTALPFWTGTGTSLGPGSVKEPPREGCWQMCSNAIGFMGGRLTIVDISSSPPTTEPPANGALKGKTRERLEKLNGLSPERHALFERIQKLKQEIGPLDFNIVKALREIRGGE